LHSSVVRSQIGRQVLVRWAPTPVEFSIGGRNIVMRKAHLNQVAARILFVVVVSSSAVAGIVSSAAASGCTTPPCGALRNNGLMPVQVKWSNNDRDWHYDWVPVGKTKGGYWNDRIDVDDYHVPSGCTFFTEGWKAKGAGWHRISSSETVTIVGNTCEG
jgi:hypothetical protein